MQSEYIQRRKLFIFLIQCHTVTKLSCPESSNVTFKWILHKIKQISEIYSFHNIETISRGKKIFFSWSIENFCSDLAESWKTILFLPDRFCYHESSINSLVPNSSFKAWNHVPKKKKTTFEYSQVFWKDNLHLRRVSPFALCIFWQLYYKKFIDLGSQGIHFKK